MYKRNRMMVKRNENAVYRSRKKDEISVSGKEALHIRQKKIFDGCTDQQMHV